MCLPPGATSWTAWPGGKMTCWGRDTWASSRPPRPSSPWLAAPQLYMAPSTTCLGGLAVHSSLVGGSVQDSGVIVFRAGLQSPQIVSQDQNITRCLPVCSPLTLQLSPSQDSPMEESRSFPPSPPQTGQAHPEASLLSSLGPYGRSESITPLSSLRFIAPGPGFYLCLAMGSLEIGFKTEFCTYLYDRDGLRNPLYICAKMADVDAKMLIYLSIFRCSLSGLLHYL